VVNFWVNSVILWKFGSLTKILNLIVVPNSEGADTSLGRQSDPQSHVVAGENLMANLENFPMVQNVSFCSGKNVIHIITT